MQTDLSMQADVDGSGSIDFKEFVAFIKALDPKDTEGSAREVGPPIGVWLLHIAALSPPSSLTQL